MFNKSGKFAGRFTAVYKPTITSPTTNQLVASRTPTLTSSSFSKYGNITHASTDWQVSDNIDFTTIRWESLSNSSNKTSITTADLGGGDRYVRVRHIADNGVVSDWSDGVKFTSPWASGGGGSFPSTTNYDVPNTGSVIVQPGTYRITIWGGGGGGAAGGGNGARSGGGAGSVSKDVTYATATTITFNIAGGGTAATGDADNSSNSYGYGGSPGGGNGSQAGSNKWNGGGGGGYSSITLGGSEMRAAGGGGAGGDGMGDGLPGGNGTAAGGAGGAGSGSSGSGGGGGGGGANGAGSPNNYSPGDGGSNSGTYSRGYNGSGTSAANRYYYAAGGYYFGDGGGAPSNGKNGGGLIEKIATQYTPVVSITSNLVTTYTATAGGSHNFSITATDTANTDSTVAYQWYLSTNGGSSYSAISGATSSTLTRYNPFYYSDNNHKIYCRATVINSVGTSFTDSNVCTLTVNRNYDCNSTTVTGNTRISVAGNKPSAPNPGQVEDWGTWSPGFSDICEIDGYVRKSDGNPFSAGGRCNFCQIGGVQQGWQLTLELRITKSTDGTRRHWGSQQQSSSGCDLSGAKQYSISANGGFWGPEDDGTPTYRLVVIGDGTNCQNGAGEDIGPQQFDDVYLFYSYKRRTYYYETRPS